MKAFLRPHRFRHLYLVRFYTTKTQSGHGPFIAECIVLGAKKRTSLPLICRTATGAASPVGRPAPRDYHQRDDAEQRGGHQVIGGR